MNAWIEKAARPYHPHLCDLNAQVRSIGAGHIRNGHVVICKAIDLMAPKRNGFAVGSVGIWGIAHFAWLPDIIAARGYAAGLVRFLRRPRDMK